LISPAHKRKPLQLDLSVAAWLACVLGDAVNVKTILSFFAAVLTGAFLVSIANTHVDLQALAGIGAEITPQVRVDAIQRDLIGFGPTLVLVLTLGFAIAFPVAGSIAGILGAGWRRFGFTISGGVAVIVIMLSIKAFYAQLMNSNMTPVASSRDVAGLLTLAIGGAAAGFLFASLTAKKQDEIAEGG
jgi:hypothetical protein